jgi:hypothetical protein
MAAHGRRVCRSWLADYPTLELRQSQLQRVDSAMAKVRALRDGKTEKPKLASGNDQS